MSRRAARELLILRHAKSDWDTDARTDFDRPLAKRGRRDCPRIAAWIVDQGLAPDTVLSSPAARARETTDRVLRVVAPANGYAPDVIWDDALYHADVPTMLAALSDRPGDARRVLLVGHNPGLDELVLHLAAGDAPRTASGKLLTTAALARFALPESWDHLPAGCGRLLALVRPREL